MGARGLPIFERDREGEGMFAGFNALLLREDL